VNIEQLSLLLLNTDQLVIQNVRFEDGKIRVSVESTTFSAKCLNCGQKSKDIHSHYMRYPADLAWGGWPVVIHLNVKRFFCRNTDCPKRTFAERFPILVSSYARRTRRVISKQQRIAVNSSAKLSEYLLQFDQIGISDTSLNRLIRSLPEPNPSYVKVLGVDDWAKRKGQRYGTILVDLESRSVIDLLQDRTADTLAQWLKTHPEVEVVSRDRSQTYAEGITRGAPQAIQVADRWHLLKNTSDTLFKIFQQEYAAIQQQIGQRTEAVNLDESVVSASIQGRPLTLAEKRRKEQMQRAREFHQQGWTQKDIACHLNLHPKTIRRYLHTTSPQVRRQRTSRLLDRYKPYLLQRWNEGCHNAMQLYREIEPKGFAGSETTVRLYIQQLRRASGLADKVRNQTGKYLKADPTKQIPTLRSLTWWTLKKPEERTEENEQVLLQISTGQPKLLKSIALARNLAEIIRQQQGEKLDAWIEEAEKSGYRAWRNFASGLKQDKVAVGAALTTPWSNGPTEGQVNRLKCLKRLMYGRAKDDLLRKRVLWQGYRTFT
jgi:transposase